MSGRERSGEAGVAWLDSKMDEYCDNHKCLGIEALTDFKYDVYHLSYTH
jgi:hypothetical protein